MLASWLACGGRRLCTEAKSGAQGSRHGTSHALWHAVVLQYCISTYLL